MAAKTDVSILQEVLVMWRRPPPNYEIVSQEDGTHINRFIYQVQCNGYIAVGEPGLSKQVAKRNAATAMLAMISQNEPKLWNSYKINQERRRVNQLPKIEKLNISSNNNVGKLSTGTEQENLLCNFKTGLDADNINFIKELNEYCQRKNLCKPVYSDDDEMENIPNKIFWIKCSLNKYVTKGSGVSKKEAKHVAAKKMYKTITDPNSSKVSEKEINILEMTKISSEKAFKQYNDLNLQSKKSFVIEEKRHIELSDWYKEIKNMFQCNKNDKPFEPLGEYLIEDDSSLNFEDLLKAMNIEYTIETLANREEKMMPYICTVSSHTYPRIVEMGVGKTEHQAKAMAVSAFIDTIMMFLN
ncbi:uncharacterized protein LOC106648557 [Trichogramma pretiosum]|uniref:uncharacterized protein LOC106648557 n=1 Tax=Trichogramma pretiosum TaxID=7493 RepID=UPI0006C9570D|nr:uncharacterized protein LOC106648557 [Trichogramma pretiosum]